MDRVNTFGDAEDFVKMILRAPDRPLVEVEISCCDAYVPYTFDVQGSCGTLIANAQGIRWKYFKPEEAPCQKLIRTPLADAQGLPIYCAESLKWYEETLDASNIVDNVFADATRRMYDDVYDHLVHGKPLGVTLKQVRQQIAVMEGSAPAKSHEPPCGGTPMISSSFSLFRLETRAVLGRKAAQDVAATIRMLLSNQARVRMVFAAAPSQNEFLSALREDRSWISRASTPSTWMNTWASHRTRRRDLAIFCASACSARFPLVPFPTSTERRATWILPARNTRERLRPRPSTSCAWVSAKMATLPSTIPTRRIFAIPWLVKRVSLDAVCRMQQVHDGCFSQLSDVPTHAITLTVPALMRAKYHFCMVPAASKRDAVYRTLCGRWGPIVRPARCACAGTPAFIWIKTAPHGFRRCSSMKRSIITDEVSQNPDEVIAFAKAFELDGLELRTICNQGLLEMEESLIQA